MKLILALIISCLTQNSNQEFEAYTLNADTTGPRFGEFLFEETTLTQGNLPGWLSTNSGTDYVFKENGYWVVYRVSFSGKTQIGANVGDIVFRDCKWDVGDGQSPSSSDACLEVTLNAGNIRVLAEYCEMMHSDAGLAAVQAITSTTVLRRCHIHDTGTTAIKCGVNMTVDECYIHTQAIDFDAPVNTHDNIIRSFGGVLKVVNSRLENQYPQDSQKQARPVAFGVRMSPQGQPGKSLRIENNWLVGPSYPISLGDDGSGWLAPRLTVRNNRIRRKFDDPNNPSGYGFKNNMLLYGNGLENYFILSLRTVRISRNATDDSRLGGHDTLITTNVPGGFEQE